MKKMSLVFAVALAFSPTAMAADIAISTQAGWFGQAAADREMQEVVDNVTAVSVEVFPSTEQAALADWVTDHTGDGVSDLLIMCGQFPDTIYAPGNSQADDSLAELFLDDGNTIINTGDYMFYVVNGAGTNAAGGLQTMMDIPGITMWDDDTAVTVTAEGQQFTPTLVDFATDRPFHLNELQGDWEPELILAQNAAGTRAEPVIVINTATGGRLGIFYQTAGQDNDPRGEVISEWINNWWIPNIAVGNPLARSPDPKDGTVFGQTWGTLSWKPGDFAVSHDVYIGVNFDDVNSGAGETFVANMGQPQQIVGFTGFPFPDGLVPGTTYYWRVDEVNDADPNSPWKGPVWSFSIPPRKAYGPNPADGAEFILPGATLGWTAGHEAKLHTIYFGDDYDTVANATTGTQSTATAYNPGALETGKTYFWRVDEFNPPVTEKGEVWSFTTLPEIPVSQPDLVAWWKLDEGMGTTVVDWSGHGNHGTLEGDPEWTDGIDAGALDLDGGGDYVNFANTSDLPAGTSARTLCGWGKTNTVAGGWRWISAYGTAGTSLAMFIGMNGTSLYGGGYGDDIPLNGLSGFWEVDVWHHICLTYDGTTARLYADGILVASEAKSWDLPLSRAHIGRQVNDAAEFWNGLVDDVRIYNRELTADEILQVMRGDTTRAWNESPANNSISDALRAATLSWSPGDAVSQHAVYFGTDRDAVAGADTSDTSGAFAGLQAGASYTPAGGVPWGSGRYYWRIDEHNTDGTVTRGTVWTFTVADYALIDDFESYNDIPAGEPGSNLVYMTWVDGFDNPNVNGSTMGYVSGASLETGNVHGGNKSVPFQFNNTTAGISEVVRTLTPSQDWSGHGIMTLSLWFAGDAANVPGQLYVKVNGVQVNYAGDAGNLARNPWQVWHIDLTAIGTDLSRVTSLAIGVQGPGASGILLLDDIRLYAKPGELVTPVQPDPAGLVAQYAFEGTANDSVGGHHGTPNGGPTYALGKFGQAIALDGIDDHVVIGPVGISGVQPRTIAGWAKASILGTPAWVNVFGFTGPSGGNGHFDIELVGDTGTTTLGWYGLHVYGWEQDIMPIDLEWHHLGASYDGTTLKWYGDGLLVGSEDRALSTPDNVHVGKRQDNTNYFPGQVDDFRLYNRVLSDEEMAGLAGITKPYDKPF